jgi:hypothetical protein
MSFSGRYVRAAVLAGLCLVPAAIGCSGASTTKTENKTEAKVTKENYEKIKTGMTREDVEKILGKGETKTGMKIGEATGDGVEYKGEKHDVHVIYKDDKVVVSHLNDKAAPKAESKVNEENYKKVKKDMSREDVEKILGKGETKTGLKIGETTGDGVVYTGDKQKVEVIYKDDKVVIAHIADK